MKWRAAAQDKNFVIYTAKKSQEGSQHCFYYSICAWANIVISLLFKHLHLLKVSHMSLSQTYSAKNN